MLGGSVYIAFIRFASSLAGVILIFSMLSESRFDRRKTMISYGCFCVALLSFACVWYVADWESLYTDGGICNVYVFFNLCGFYEQGFCLSDYV